MSIKKQGKALIISRSTAYYKSRRKVEEKDIEILKKIRETLILLPFYGYRKIALEINSKGLSVSRKQIRRIMRKAGLMAIFPGENLSKARQESKKYPYLLEGKIIRYPNQVWAADLTYIKLPSGHVYLMAVIDLYSRKVLNWIITNTLDAPIFANCLHETIEKYGVAAIFNTDQGCQFTSPCWTEVLHDYGIRISMDGKNRAPDNIFVERLWRSLKYEDIYIKHYETVKELKEGVTQYFNFSNTRRFHQSLEYRTPDEIHESFQAVSLAEQAA